MFIVTEEGDWINLAFVKRAFRLDDYQGNRRYSLLDVNNEELGVHSGIADGNELDEILKAEQDRATAGNKTIGAK